MRSMLFIILCGFLLSSATAQQPKSKALRFKNRPTQVPNNEPLNIPEAVIQAAPDRETRRILEKIQAHLKAEQAIIMAAPPTFKAGLVCRMNGYFNYRVQRIISPTEILAKLGPLYDFLVEGIDTEGLVDDAAISFPPDMPFQVSARKYGSRTLFSIKPWEPETKPTADETRTGRLFIEKYLDERGRKAKTDADQKVEQDAKLKARDDAIKAEASAAARLKLAKQLITDGLPEAARFRLEKLIKEAPSTKAAQEAKKILDGDK